jgi:hypothetical protein
MQRSQRIYLNSWNGDCVPVLELPSLREVKQRLTIALHTMPFVVRLPKLEKGTLVVESSLRATDFAGCIFEVPHLPPESITVEGNSYVAGAKATAESLAALRALITARR